MSDRWMKDFKAAQYALFIVAHSVHRQRRSEEEEEEEGLFSFGGGGRGLVVRVDSAVLRHGAANGRSFVWSLLWGRGGEEGGVGGGGLCPCAALTEGEACLALS